MRVTLFRAVLLAAAVALAGCARGGGGERVSTLRFEPLRYDFLTPIPLRVASVEVDQRFVPAPSEAGGSPLDPIQPVAAMRQMAQDRLRALGTTGRAVLAINDASLLRRGRAYEGSFAVELDIYTSANERAAFAEARVSGRRTIGSDETAQAARSALIRQLMDQLNVELEYQVRRSLRDWLVTESAPPPAPVAEQPLPAPTR